MIVRNWRGADRQPSEGRIKPQGADGRSVRICVQHQASFKHCEDPAQLAISLIALFLLSDSHLMAGTMTGNDDFGGRGLPSGYARSGGRFGRCRAASDGVAPGKPSDTARDGADGRAFAERCDGHRHHFGSSPRQMMRASWGASVHLRASLWIGPRDPGTKLPGSLLTIGYYRRSRYARAWHQIRARDPPRL